MSQKIRESRTLYPSSNLIRKRENINNKNPSKDSVLHFNKTKMLNETVENNILSRELNLSLNVKRRSRTI